MPKFANQSHQAKYFFHSCFYFVHSNLGLAQQIFAHFAKITYALFLYMHPLSLVAAFSTIYSSEPYVHSSFFACDLHNGAAFGISQ